MFRCLIVVSAWAVWCFDDFEPVEVGLYVSVARHHGCEVLCLMYFCV